jgi:pimeloyl-ACP methyl ester carboxylesterase
VGHDASKDGFRHRHVAVADSQLHVVEAGDPDGLPCLFLHGWPESWQSWQRVMAVAARQARPLAIDLPGVGESSGAATDGSKRQLAAVVHELITTLGLREVTLVGQDAGGMIAYAYLRTYQDVARVVIMDVVLPGVDPWEEVLRNPYLWHFAMHMIPALPERLVQGHQQEYFDYFFDVLSHDKRRISAQARAAYAKAYATDAALTAGFNWYRTLYQDAAENRQAAAGSPGDTPLLYLRGAHETGDIDEYVRGLQAAGVTRVDHALVPDAGHFSQEEASEQTWQLIVRFAGLESGRPVA